MRIRCPKCKTPVDSGLDKAGLVVNCAGCGGKLQIPLSPQEAPSVAAPSAAPTSPATLDDFLRLAAERKVAAPSAAPASPATSVSASLNLPASDTSTPTAAQATEPEVRKPIPQPKPAPRAKLLSFAQVLLSVMVLCFSLTLVGFRLVFEPAILDHVLGKAAIIVFMVGIFVSILIAVFACSLGSLQFLHDLVLAGRARWEEYQREENRKNWSISVRKEAEALRQTLEDQARKRASEQLNQLLNKGKLKLRKELSSYRDEYRKKLEKETKEQHQQVHEQARNKAYNDARCEAQARAQAWYEDERKKRDLDLKHWEENERRKRGEAISAEMRRLKEASERALELWQIEERERCRAELESTAYGGDEWAEVIGQKCSGVDCLHALEFEEEALQCRCTAWYCLACAGDIAEKKMACKARPTEKEHCVELQDFRWVRRKRPPVKKKKKHLSKAGVAQATTTSEPRPRRRVRFGHPT